MARIKKITNKKLKEEIEKYILDLLAMEIEWKNGFGKTYRKNGDLVEGSVRDILDEGLDGGLASTLYVKIREKGITIGFGDAAADHIFDEKRGRPEFWDYVLERMPKDLALIVAQYAIYKRLANPNSRRRQGKIRIN